MTLEQFFEHTKDWIIPIIAVLFGATAHALDRIRKYGWKGWVDMGSDIIACSFIGFAFYQLALLVRPEVAVVACSVGAYWGTKGFVFIKDSVIGTLQSNLDKLKD